MSKKTKKAMSMLLVVALIAAIAVGGMLAYLTDRDSEANVFTVGDVKISLEEVFDQNAELKPGVDIEKKVDVKNTGKNDAWVWVEIAIPKILDGGQDAAKNIVHFNYPKESAGDGAGQWTWLKDSNGWVIDEKTLEDGVTYNIYTVLYNSALASGTTTATSAMSKVYLDSHIDIDLKGDWYWIENGNVTGPYWNSKDKVNLYVSAYAMQKENFATVEAAYAAYQTQWGDQGKEFPKMESVDTITELKTAITEGGTYILTTSMEVSENLAVSADTVIYGSDDNVLTFTNNAKISVNADKSLALYGVQMDAEGEYSFGADGSITYDADARRTTPLLNAGAGSELILGNGTVVENVVAKGSAVIQANGTDANRATVVLAGATIQNCAGESGTIINVAKASDVVIEEGTVISNNASYNNNNHGIIRVYNAWDAANPSTVTMNGGQISGNYYSGNGMIGLYYGKFILNGGEINDNSWFADNQVHNGWYPVIYVHSNSKLEMNGGEIAGNTVKYGVINSLNSSVDGALTINGGTITNNIATNNNNTDACAVVISETKKSLVVSDAANVTGTVWVYYDADGNYIGKYYDTVDNYFNQQN